MFFALVAGMVAVAMASAVARRSLAPSRAVAPAAAMGFFCGVAVLLLFSLSGWQGGSHEWLLAAARVLGAGGAGVLLFVVLARFAYLVSRRLSPPRRA